jgi:hypothetical protein
MTTTTVVVGLILIFVLFTRAGRALGVIGVVVLGVWLAPTIWRNWQPQPPASDEVQNQAAWQAKEDNDKRQREAYSQCVAAEAARGRHDFACPVPSINLFP